MDVVQAREDARYFLRHHKWSADRLAKRLDLNYWWVVKFRSGTIHDCSAERLQRVLDFMAAEQKTATASGAANINVHSEW